MKYQLAKASALIDKLVDQEITEQEHQLLQTWLKGHVELRREYIRRMQLHSSLQVYADVEDARHGDGSFVPLGLAKRKGVKYFSAGPLLYFACSLVLCLLVGVVGWNLAPRPPAIPLTVVAVDGVSPEQSIEVGSQISGPIRIDQGLLTLATKGGSLISLEGPCDFQMVDVNVGRLDRGNLVAFCGENAEKITVNTPNMQYTDLGTEFGVRVAGESSSLHVFDGLVMAADNPGGNSKRVLVEAASSLRTDSKDHHSRGGLVDLVSFNSLRKSLADGGVSEDFGTDPIASADPRWAVSFRHVDQWTARVESKQPLAPGLGDYLRVTAVRSKNTDPASDAATAFSEDLSQGDKKFSAMVSFDYAKLNGVDLKKAHTVECVFRLESNPDDVRGLMMFGGEEVDWQKRAWELRGLPNRGKLMWSNYNPKQKEIQKYQYLETEANRVYHLLVEIDPVIGRYRKTVSDGKNRVWSELSDGSAAKLKLSANSLGKLHWRIRGIAGSELSFSIDAIRIRNRPDFTVSVR